MNLRLALSLVAGLAAIDFAARMLDRGAATHQAGRTQLDEPLLDSATLARARRIVIREKPQTKVVHREEGFIVRRVAEAQEPVRETTLARDASDRWVVTNCFNLEADDAWLAQTMRDLTRGRLVRHVTAAPGLMRDLELGIAEVRLEDSTGRVLRRIEFGRKDGGDAYQFARLDDRDAFVAKHDAELVGDAMAWVAGRLFTGDLADAHEVELPFAEAGEPPLTLRRATRGAPLVIVGATGAEAAGVSARAQDVVAKLLAEPLLLAIERDAPAAAAACANIAARVRVVRFDGREHRVAFGVVPRGSAGAAALAPHDAASVAFAFAESSDPQDLSVRQGARAALGYNRAGTLGRLPKNRAALLNAPSPASP